MPHDINAILADTAAYGFVFEDETVRVGGRGDKGKAYDKTPILKVVDLDKFNQAFPGIVLESINGQSIKVGSQRIGRDLREAGEKNGSHVREANVRWLLGIKVSTPRYVGPEGATFGTREEAEAAWLEWAVEKAK